MSVEQGRSVMDGGPKPGVAADGTKRRVTVVGAGFSGLVSAYYLSRAGFEVEVFERRDRPGGLISTVRTSFGLVETAANGFLNSPLVEELFRALNLELIPTLSKARKRFIFRKGRPRQWPLGLLASLHVLWFLIRFLLIRKSVAPREGESIRGWSTRVMGLEASRYLVEAAMQGIYSGDPAQMSARLIVGRFFRKSPSGRAGTETQRVRFRGTVSARGGMGELIEKLRERLQREGVKFVFSQELKPMDQAPNWPVIFAGSARDAATFLAKVDPDRAAACSAVDLLPISSVAIGFRQAPPENRQGFGCLFPPVEEKRPLGVLMNSFIFEGRATKGFSETWIFGGAKAGGRELAAKSDQELVEIAIEERQNCLGGTPENFGSRVTRWPAALPHYTVELEQKLADMRGLRRNVVLMGNYLGEIGLSRILERASFLPEAIAASGDWPYGS
jgi:oxygen-dependent protoporphyrinogen oxidase